MKVFGLLGLAVSAETVIKKMLLTFFCYSYLEIKWLKLEKSSWTFWKSIRKDSSGIYGFTIHTKAKRRHFIAEIVEDSQAEKVEIPLGWKIVEINGTPVEGLMNEEVAELMVKQDEAIILLSDDTKLYNGRVIHENNSQ